MFDIGFAELLVIGVVALLVIGPERLPQTVRTASLWLNDHKFRPDLSPWVAGVYVTEECRGRGVAQALLAFAAENTWKLGYDRLFAVTPLTGFYEKCGWTYHADGICPHGQQKRIYAVDRSSSS